MKLKLIFLSHGLNRTYFDKAEQAQAVILSPEPTAFTSEEKRASVKVILKFL